MNRTMQIVKYQMHDVLKAIGVFYIVILASGLFITTISVSDHDSNISFGGLGMTTVVFLFIYAITTFKVNFQFMQANNLSRKSFYLSTAATWMMLAGLMAILESVFNKVLSVNIPYKGVFEQLYRKNVMVEDFLWCFALFIFTICLGWTLTLLYYRSNLLMKIVVSIILAFLVALPGILMILLGQNVVKEFFDVILGFSDNFNAYRAVLSFWVAALGLYGLSYLLLRRAPIK